MADMLPNRDASADEPAGLPTGQAGHSLASRGDPQRDAVELSTPPVPLALWSPAPPFPHELPPADRAHLAQVLERIRERSVTLAGYPCNQRFDYSELFPFLALSGNNVGDPFADSNYGLNTHDIEREVLSDFTRLTQGKESEVWGYVTSGGTEGNLYGLYLARELLPNGIVYYSEETHYSVAKSLRLLGVRSIMIRSQPSGELDYDDLRETLKVHRDAPPILFLNIGTTMKGAIDDVARIQSILVDLRLSEHYIHCDAALSGMILPFVDEPPAWNFATKIDSISVSGHKMLGAPVPCGVVVARKRNVDRIARSVEYVGVLDTTIGGSRSAFAPLLLWYALRRLGDDGLRQMVQGSLRVADYAVSRMNEAEIPAWKNQHSITVVLPRPSDEVLRRWQIAPQGAIGHLITMPHVTEATVDAFISDYLGHPPEGFVRCARPGPGSHVISASHPPPPAALPPPPGAGLPPPPAVPHPAGPADPNGSALLRHEQLRSLPPEKERLQEEEEA